MNNQAAQTMPELPEPSMTAFTKADGVTPFWHYDGVPLVREGRRPDSDKNKAIYLYTADQMHQYARDYALSQTAGVAEGMVMVQKHDLEWIVAHVLDECDGSGPCADLAARRVRALLAAAPAASGGECNCASGRGSEHCVVHANTVWDQPQTAPEPLAQGEARIQSEAQCAQIVLDGMNGPRRCMFKPVRGDTLCKRHRASADKTGYMPSKLCASPQPAAEGSDHG